MMLPKDWKFVFKLVEVSTRRAYERGVKDAKENKELPEDKFRVSRPVELILKKQYSDFMKNT